MSLGPCFATALPNAYLKNLNPSDFLNYYSNTGKTFQPDTNDTNVISGLISNLAAAQSSKETFVFSDLNDLAIFYSYFGSLNVVIFMSFISKLNPTKVLKKN